MCSKNRLRSPTAEAVFSEYEGIDAIGAGTNADADTPVSGDLIDWADLIFVMENTHKSKISKKYQRLLKSKRVVVLEIPDIYGCMQPELIQLLKRKVSQFVHL